MFNHMSGGSSVRLVPQRRAGVERESERERASGQRSLVKGTPLPHDLAGVILD